MDFWSTIMLGRSRIGYKRLFASDLKAAGKMKLMASSDV
jgi:hypothetical protein